MSEVPFRNNMILILFFDHFQALPDFDVQNQILAEDAGIGHHSTENKEDAGQKPN